MSIKEKAFVKINRVGLFAYNLEGRLHREDGPAIEYTDGSKVWYQCGELHREDGPAVENIDGTKKWYQHGKLHRRDGPSVEYADGTKLWHRNGIFMKKVSEV